MLEITVPDTTKPVDATVPKATKEFAVVLKGNETTGYVWELGPNPLPTGIKATGDKYKVDLHPEKLPGVGGKHTFSFKSGNEVIGKRVSLWFHYKRSWEPEPVKKVEVRVTFSATDDTKRGFREFF
ncbi:hypothetical protein BCR33DRAFT_715347, partial [Rhizoclosmatium globosum]